MRDEPLASIIQEALQGFAHGRFNSQVEVKRFLERQPHFPKDLPNGEIRNQRITDILLRSTYAGMVEAPRWGVTLREGEHEALISLETFEKIQKRLREGSRASIRKDRDPDFPLRGAVVCGDCGEPLTAAWSKGKTKRHPYYFCFNKSCVSHRKSIRRDKIEGDFEALLKQLRPSETLFEMVQAIFRDEWEKREAQGAQIAASLKSSIGKVEKQIEQLVDRIVDASSQTVVSAYEKRLSKLEMEKLITQEKLQNASAPQRPFQEMFELALNFVSNPCNIWKSQRLEDKRMVLRLVFFKRPAYCRKEGFRTPEFSLPFKALRGVCMQKCEMARLDGESLNSLFEELHAWEELLKDIDVNISEVRE